jgi:hypothetical protein
MSVVQAVQDVHARREAGQEQASYVECMEWDPRAGGMY